jgi:hypothetical protein
LEEVSEVAAHQGPELLYMLIPAWKVIACDQKTSKNFNGKQAGFNALNGTAFIVTAIAEEGLPALYLAHVYSTQYVEDFWCHGLQGLACPEQATSGELFDDVEEDEECARQLQAVGIRIGRGAEDLEKLLKQIWPAQVSDAETWSREDLPVIWEFEADDLGDHQGILQGEAVVCLVDGTLEEPRSYSDFVLFAHSTVIK